MLQFSLGYTISLESAGALAFLLLVSSKDFECAYFLAFKDHHCLVSNNVDRGTQYFYLIHRIVYSYDVGVYFLLPFLLS